VKVGFRQSFLKDLEGVNDKRLRRRVKAAIEEIEKAESLQQINGLKKLKGRTSPRNPYLFHHLSPLASY
jgi:hypothetical protein